jgi:acid phosphatase/tartrate-resistant acid phosphatase type 5
VDIVYIDTISLTGVIDTVQNVTSELLANATVVDEEQLVWIENTLKESTADYIFVVGHYPILSACSSGGTPALLSALHPLFVKYGAHYFAGMFQLLPIDAC